MVSHSQTETVDKCNKGQGAKDKGQGEKKRRREEE